jgi:hypothetical protein
MGTGGRFEPGSLVRFCNRREALGDRGNGQVAAQMADVQSQGYGAAWEGDKSVRDAPRIKVTPASAVGRTSSGRRCRVREHLSAPDEGVELRIMGREGDFS